MAVEISQVVQFVRVTSNFYLQEFEWVVLAPQKKKKTPENKLGHNFHLVIKTITILQN